MAINAQILAEMEVPENSLPKVRSITRNEDGYIYLRLCCICRMVYQALVSQSTRASQWSFLIQNSSFQQWTCPKLLTSIVIWKREMHQKDAHSSCSVTICLTFLTIGCGTFCFRVLESLANTVTSRIEDVLYADSVAQDPSLAMAKSADSSPQQPLS